MKFSQTGLVLLALILQSGCATAPAMESNFDKVQIGMTYHQVAEIMGPPAAGFPSSENRPYILFCYGPPYYAILTMEPWRYPARFVVGMNAEGKVIFKYFEPSFSDFKKVKPGMTKSEVDLIMGKPVNDSAIFPADAKIFAYGYGTMMTQMTDSGGMRSRFTLEFDSSGHFIRRVGDSRSLPIATPDGFVYPEEP